MHNLPVRILLALASLLLAAAARADPLLSVNLASDTAWTSVTAQDAVPRIVPVPGQIALRKTDGPWIEYRRTITVPKIAPNQVTVLRLGSLNDGGTVFVNGHRAGEQADNGERCA